MKVKDKVFGEDGFRIREMSREQIAVEISLSVDKVCDNLIERGLAQHRDEARILVARALDSIGGTVRIGTVAKSLLDKGHIGFCYDNGAYKNVNFDE